MTSSTTGNIARKAPRLLTVVAPLLAISLSACGAQESGQSQPQETPTKSASQQQSTTSPAQNADSSAGFQDPKGAVESFVTQVLQKRYKKACAASAPLEKTEKEVQARCGKKAAQAMLKSLHKAWAKPGVKLPPEAEVKVTKVTKNGNKARVLDSAVTLDGRTLREIELIQSSGNTQSFNLSFKLRKQDSSWHLTGLKISA